MTDPTDPTHVDLCFFLKQDDPFPTTALSIPIEEIPYYTHFPLKWLRFLGYALYGVEGRLSETVGGVAVDYLRVDGLKPSYYYVPDTVTERQISTLFESFSTPDPLYPLARFCLIDVDALSCSSHTTSSSIPESRKNFRSNIWDRDDRCIMTGVDDSHCSACHIIPHARGSEVSRSYVRHLESTLFLERVSERRERGTKPAPWRGLLFCVLRSKKETPLGTRLGSRCLTIRLLPQITDPSFSTSKDSPSLELPQATM